MLYIFSGLPGVGKSELAKLLAISTGSTYLRIDSLEQALRDEGVTDVNGKGYSIAYRIAFDNLKLGMSVVADCVNPITLTRETWHKVSRDANVPFYDIEVICSDQIEHKLRIETRKSEILGLELPSWQDVRNRRYQQWPDYEHIIVDTAGLTLEQSIGILNVKLGKSK